MKDITSAALDEPNDVALSSAVLAVFIGELTLHCLGAERAYTAMVMALSERRSDGTRSALQIQKIFVQIDAFLFHVAMLSQNLWLEGGPQERERTEAGDKIAGVLAALRSERGAQLREVLGPEVALLQDLGLWEYFVHRDARIEIWAMSNAGDGSAIVAMDVTQGLDVAEARPAVRQLDSISLSYCFCGEEFDLPAIAAVVSWLGRTLHG